MTRDPITIDENASIKGRLAGIITDRMLKDYSPGKATTLHTWQVHYLLSKTAVKEAMNPHPNTVTPDAELTKAARIIRDNKLYGLCVVDDQEDGTPPSDGRHAEIGGSDSLVARESARGTGQRNATVLHDESTIRERECVQNVLLDQNDRDALLANGLQRREDFAHQQRRKPECRLIEQEQSWPRHQSAANRAHLLLTARQRSRFLACPFFEDRKHREDVLQRLTTHTSSGWRVRPHVQVLENRHRRPQLARFGNQDHSPLDHLVWGGLCHVSSIEHNSATTRFEQPRHASQSRRFSGAVRADQCDDLALRDVEGHAPESL